jgi:hypothetical protein
LVQIGLNSWLETKYQTAQIQSLKLMRVNNSAIGTHSWATVEPYFWGRFPAILEELISNSKVRAALHGRAAVMAGPGMDPFYANM